MLVNVGLIFEGLEGSFYPKTAARFHFLNWLDVSGTFFCPDFVEKEEGGGGEGSACCEEMSIIIGHKN